ncbi:hypothetical protein, partial [Actinacidiphila glaucinigra]|uniref:hypothetical protein n=1 Tax=Actinacidiphila glaucinigra TaxID=235986 RepID=UPI0035E28394
MTDTRPGQAALTPRRVRPASRHILTDHRDITGYPGVSIITAGHRRLVVADHRDLVITVTRHSTGVAGHGISSLGPLVGCAGHTASRRTRNTAGCQ